MMKRNTSGFTIVELLIATTIFSIVILGASITILEVSRLYYKGTILTRTQNATRDLLDSISRPMQLEKKTIIQENTAVNIGGRQVKILCVGTTRFTYVEGFRQGVNTSGFDGSDTIAHAIWRDEVAVPSDCGTTVPDLTAITPTPLGRNVLQENMRVRTLSVTKLGSTDRLWAIDVHVLYGEKDLMRLDGSSIPEACLGDPANSKWCASTLYSTRVFKRIN